MTPDIHTLAGAYVLDAVEDHERDAFEAHLAECESCTDEVAALRSTAAALALDQVSAPPAHLRTAVLAAAQRTPQLPPLPARPLRARRRLPRLLAAAAAAVVLAGVGVTFAVLHDDNPQQQVTAVQVFDASDVRVKDIPFRGGQLHVAVSAKLGRLAVDGRDMPAPPPDTVYQLWLVRGGEATSLSVMEGDVTSAVEDIPSSGVLALTTEPPGGSDQPTSDPVLTLDPATL